MEMAVLFHGDLVTMPITLTASTNGQARKRLNALSVRTSGQLSKQLNNDWIIVFLLKITIISSFLEGTITTWTFELPGLHIYIFLIVDLRLTHIFKSFQIIMILFFNLLHLHLFQFSFIVVLHAFQSLFKLPFIFQLLFSIYRLYHFFLEQYLLINTLSVLINEVLLIVDHFLVFFNFSFHFFLLFLVFEDILLQTLYLWFCRLYLINSLL